jgi:hypothetical protein
MGVVIGYNLTVFSAARGALPYGVPAAASNDRYSHAMVAPASAVISAVS